MRSSPFRALFGVLVIAASTRPAIDAANEPVPPHAVGRLGEARWRHGSRVSHLACSPDGSVVASSGDDFGVCLWDASTGRRLRVCDDARGHHQAFASAFSPDGKRIVVSQSGATMIYDTSTGRVIRELKGRTNVSVSVAWSDDGRRIATVWGTTIRLWAPAEGKEMMVLEGHTRPVTSVAFAPRSKLLASSGSDGTVRIWDPVSGRQVRRFETGDLESSSIAFSLDGSLLAWRNRAALEVCATDGNLPMRTISNGQVSILTHTFSPDSKMLAVGESEGGIRLLDVATGKEVRRWQAHRLATSSLCYSRDGKTLFSGSPFAATVGCWDPATGRETVPDEGHRASIGSLRFAPDGKTLLSIDSDHRAISWSLASRLPRQIPIPVSKAIGGGRIAISTDGRLIALSGRDKPFSAITLYETETGKLLHGLAGHTSPPVFDLAFSHDGKRLASTGQDATSRLWDVRTGKQLAILDSRFPRRSDRRSRYPLRFSPDDRMLVSTADFGQLRVYDLDAGKLSRVHRIGENVEADALAFSSSGDRIALALRTVPASLAIWNPGTGDLERSWITPDASLFDIAFSPEGRWLASGGGQGECHVRLWDVEMGQEVAVFQSPQGGVAKLAFSWDGRTLASGGLDSTIVLWDVTGLGNTPGKRMSAARQAQLWKLLPGDNARQVHAAIWELALTPGGVDVLRHHMKPVLATNVTALVKQLGADDFATRNRASQQLESLAGRAIPGLRMALEAKPEPEVRRRIERSITHFLRSVEHQRELRGLSALEAAGSKASRALLEELAAGAPKAPLTEAAARALGRMRSRNSASEERKSR